MPRGKDGKIDHNNAKTGDDLRDFVNLKLFPYLRGFLDFVLSHYVSAGVDELDPEKLTPLLRLRYRDSIADAIADLGRPEEIGRVFASFQKFLYQPAA